MKSRLILAVAAALTIAGCGNGDKDTDKKPTAAEQGRKETQSIRNTQAIGYEGKAIANQVDKALDASDKRKEETDKAVENIDQ